MRRRAIIFGREGDDDPHSGCLVLSPTASVPGHVREHALEIEPCGIEHVASIAIDGSKNVDPHDASLAKDFSKLLYPSHRV